MKDSDDISGASTAQTAGVVLEEARHTLDRQDARSAHVETKASWLLATNAALVAFAASIIPKWLQSMNRGGVEVVLVSSGLFALITSTALTLMALQTKRYTATQWKWLHNLPSTESLGTAPASMMAILAADAFDKAQQSSGHTEKKANRFRQALYAQMLAIACAGALSFGAIIDHIGS